MVRPWNHIFGIILLLFQITALIRCRNVCHKEAIPYSSVYYGKTGGHIILVVEAVSKNYTWEKDGRPLEICKSYSGPICKNAKLITFNKRADLLLQHVTPEDSGKYVVELSCPHRAIYSFEVIVQSSPLLFIDCQDMVAYEGENISCICKATNMNSSTSVTWTRNKTEQSNLEAKKFTDILTLFNVSKSESGTYTCHVKNNRAVNETSFRLEVFSKGTKSAMKGTTVKPVCSNATTLALFK